MEGCFGHFVLEVSVLIRQPETVTFRRRSSLSAHLQPNSKLHLHGPILDISGTFDDTVLDDAYEQVAKNEGAFRFVEQFKGYRLSYEKEHTQASNDLPLHILSLVELVNYLMLLTTSVEALLSKKPPTL
ncbi:hypothetical protein Tco_1068261 [Tanacetum coccineum]|uniref:Uncharacterized protein n=1 Tax=Tanacetum coccineum TaxID=301880 RepID=A0ABQ5HFD1_9ASTR